jgi:hypothetical protein
MTCRVSRLDERYGVSSKTTAPRKCGATVSPVNAACSARSTVRRMSSHRADQLSSRFHTYGLWNSGTV